VCACRQAGAPFELGLPELEQRKEDSAHDSCLSHARAHACEQAAHALLLDGLLEHLATPERHKPQRSPLKSSLMLPGVTLQLRRLTELLDTITMLVCLSSVDTFPCFNCTAAQMRSKILVDEQCHQWW